MRRTIGNKILALALTVMLALPMLTGFVNAAEETNITIYHTNDIHGAVAYDDDSCIGLEKVSALKKSTDNAILVDGGDATQGLPFASLTKGADVIEVMNLAGYDLMTLGNHEFDYGIQQLLNNVSAAKFPVLSANTYYNGELLLKGRQPALGETGSNGSYTIIQRDGKKIGFFGLTTAETATSTNPDGMKGVTFADEIKTAMAQIDALEAQKVDAIVAVAHSGYEGLPNCAADLAKALTGTYAGKLDVIIDGHSHTTEQITVNDVLIVQTGTGLVNLGEVTLSFDDDGNLAVSSRLLNINDMKNVALDDAVSAKIQAVNDSQKEILSQQIGTAANSLWGGWINGEGEARMMETNLGDLITDAFCDAAEPFVQSAHHAEAYRDCPIIGVENGGGIRATISNGPVTQGDLISVLPFSNTVMVRAITPSVLYQVLEISVSNQTRQDAKTGLLIGQTSGSFLQVSGIRFRYDPSETVGNKVKEVYLDETGQKLERNDTATGLVLVSNSYIMAGGGGYDVLKNCPMLGELGGEVEIVADYIQKLTDGGKTPLNIPIYQKRITIDGDYQPKPYTVRLLVTHEDGTPAAKQEVSYYIDGGAPAWAVTDDDGYLTVTLEDGPHSLALSRDQEQIYVNNYTGSGLIEDIYRTLPVLSYQEPEEKPQQGTSDSKLPQKDPDPQQVPDSQQNPDSQETDVQKQTEQDRSPDMGEDDYILWAAFSWMAAAACSGILVVKGRRSRRS